MVITVERFACTDGCAVTLDDVIVRVAAGVFGLHDAQLVSETIGRLVDLAGEPAVAA